MSDLERRLEAIATGIDWPEADVTGAVLASIESGQRATTRKRWMQVALAAAAIALLVLVTPAGRHAVADLLEVAGIRVQWADSEPAPGAGLDLGTQVTLESASDRVPFALLFPTDADVGAPDEIYHSDFPPGGAVHLVWGAGPSLPAAGDTDVGLLYSQFRVGPLGGGFVKGLRPETQAITVTVRRSDGFWIEGAPHIVFYEDQSGVQERARLAANVLAWEENGVTHRIETTLGLDETVDLAESLSPTP